MLLSAFKQMLTGQSHIRREILGWCCYAVAVVFLEWLLGCF